MKQMLRTASNGLDVVVRFRDRHIRHFYNGDAMRIGGREFGFLSDPKFKRAYDRGMDSGHHMGRAKGSKDDLHIEFRVYIECWAAQQGLRMPGDFVCCGVNTGVGPLAIYEYTDLDGTDKRFWLFDTYAGVPERQMSKTERVDRVRENEEFYFDCYEVVKKNFAPYKGARIVRGEVPDTLPGAGIERVAYLSIDMNIAYPERKAIEYFWPKLSPGAIVILDDYGFINRVEQRRTMNEWATGAGVSILALPTGQGLIIKPML